MEEEGSLAAIAVAATARVMEPPAVQQQEGRGGEGLALLMQPAREEALFQPRIEPAANFEEKVWILPFLQWTV
jgi:hypothetical protein